MVFFGEPRTEAAKNAKESPLVMTIPLMILAFLSLFGGSLNLPFEGFHNLGHWLEATLKEVESLPLNYQVAGISTVLALIGIAFCLVSLWTQSAQDRADRSAEETIGSRSTRGMENKWWVDELYNAIIITPYVKISVFPGGCGRLALLA